MSNWAPHYLFPKTYADFVQRLRVPCGFLLLVTFALFSQPSPTSLFIGLPVSLCGLLLRAWAAGHLAKNRDLAVSGPYSYMRNPLYAGTIIIAAGIVIAARSSILVPIFAAVFLLVYLPAIELEEQHLRNIFPNYARYAERINRFLPCRKWQEPGSSFASGLYWKNEEYKASLGFVLAVAWLVWKCLKTAASR
jgi:protein-S-isoprenylcysteine O-methyltransferase Ste14